MMRFVLDASCVGPLIIPDETENLLPDLLVALDEGEGLVPSHWHFEVGNMALAAVRRQRVAAEAVAANLGDLAQLRIETDVLSPHYAWSRSMELAKMHGLSLYDAAYLELAGRQALPLLSMDSALLAAAAAAGIATGLSR